jgi:hypothetical protein
MPMSEPKTPPILRHKNHEASSAFTPENLLRQGRRQKRLPNIAVPEICILDPDGDIVRNLRATERASQHEGWACYHTELYAFRNDGYDYGIVGGAVGAAFAVLIAEELFASGCRLLISITSAGQIAPVQSPPYFVVIDRALRDEGTSYHYLPASEYSDRARRSQLDDRCAVSGNRGGNSCGLACRNSRGRNGSGGAVRVCKSARSSSRVFRPCDQSNGPHRRRLRKRGIGRR